MFVVICCDNGIYSTTPKVSTKSRDKIKDAMSPAVLQENECYLTVLQDTEMLSCSAARYKDAILQCCKIQTARYKDAILQCCKIQRCYVAVLQEDKRYLTVLQDKYLSSKSKAKTYKTNKKKNA